MKLGVKTCTYLLGGRGWTGAMPQPPVTCILECADVDKFRPEVDYNISGQNLCKLFSDHKVVHRESSNLSGYLF